MRTLKSLLTALLLSFTVALAAQGEPSINDFNFESTTNTSFILLDETPTSFSTPDNLKALGLYLSNGLANTNVAVEVNPYWIFGWHKEDTSYEQYRGISTHDDRVRIDPFKRVKTNSSISFAFVDKEFPNLQDPRKTLSLGGRCTFIELYSQGRIKELNTVLEDIGSSFSNEVLDEFDGYVTGPFEFGDLTTPSDPDECAQSVDSGTYPIAYVQAAEAFFNENKDLVQTRFADAGSLLKAYFQESCGVSSAFIFNAQNIQPIFRLDGAVGHSWLFKENNFDSETVTRFGSWLTADLAVRFTDAQYLHVFAIAKYINDGFQIDQAGEFTTTDFFDYGAKIELELDKFKLSYEYLERTGDGAMFRSVGNIYYQLTKSLSITGGFGKDFQVEDNLISILGISWGIDSGESPFGG